MTEKRFTYDFVSVDCPMFYDNKEVIDYDDVVDCLNNLHEENQQLKSDLARTIEQAHKNNKLLVSDIRTLEKALWCPECTNNMKRLKELRKEFLE